MIGVLGSKKGICPFCLGKEAKEKDLFVVNGSHTGEICSDHLVVMAQQLKKPKREKEEEIPEATLFRDNNLPV